MTAIYVKDAREEGEHGRQRRGLTIDMIIVNNVDMETNHASPIPAGTHALLESDYQGISRVEIWHSEANAA